MASQILVNGAISRLEIWLKSLEGDFANSTATHGAGHDIGAVGYLELLRQLLAIHREAFERYRLQTAAPPDQRLRWLQQVGEGLANLELLFGHLSVPVAPTLTPMLAAFSRLLERLVPGRPPIFRPVRDFNYELEEFHSTDFADLLLDKTKAYQWPMLFITLPTGLLDSPRAHVLVAHEIGHAVAAVHRESVALNEIERAEATAAGTLAPPLLAPMLPLPAPSTKDILQIVKERWEEFGLPPPKDRTGPQPTVADALLLGIVADVGGDITDLVTAWLEELFSDAIGTCLFGPAFLVSMLDVLLTTGSMARGSASHPPLAARLQCIGQTLQHAKLGFTANTFLGNLKERYETAMTEAHSALQGYVASKGSDGELDAVVRRLVLGRIDSVVSIAVDYIEKCDSLYTASQFTRDTERYIPEFVQTGVPPLEGTPSLAAVFNVGQVLCSDHIELFCPGVGSRDKEQRIDDLLLKAIELNEIATSWGEA